MKINGDELAMALANALQMQQDPEAHRREAARRATRDHIMEGRPSPVEGNKVRCVFTTQRPAFEEGEMIFEEGRVYNVGPTGVKAMELRRELHKKADDVADERYAEILVNMADFIADHPNAAGTTCFITDPVSGQSECVTFPSYPSAVFVLVADDAVDEPMLKELPEGTEIMFTDFTIIGDKATGFKKGVTYKLGAAHPACGCEDPACPGKNVIIYPVNDGEMDVEMTMPFSAYGVAEVITPKH